MFDVSRLSALASSVPSLPSSTSAAKSLGLGLSALFIRSCFRCKPIQENFFKKLGLASLQAFLFEGSALLGAYGINEGSKYLIGKKFTQLHIPLNVALTVLGVTTFFIFMHQANGSGAKPVDRELFPDSPPAKETRTSTEVDELASPAAAPATPKPTTTPHAENHGGWKTPAKFALAALTAAQDTADVVANGVKTPVKGLASLLSKTPSGESDN